MPYVPHCLIAVLIGTIVFFLMQTLNELCDAVPPPDDRVPRKWEIVAAIFVFVLLGIYNLPEMFEEIEIVWGLFADLLAEVLRTA